MASLWEKIDTYLVDEIHAEMGANGDYTDLVVVHVMADDLLTLEKAIQNDEFPLILLRGLEVSETVSQHGTLPGGGKLPLEHIYPYKLISICKTDGKANCRRDAQEMRRRVLLFLAGHRALGGLAGDDGERVRGIRFDKSTLTMYGRSDAEDATFYGITETSVSFESRS